MSTISLPGWDSIISIPQGEKPTRQQVTEYYQARSQHRQPNLSASVIDEIERRKDIRDRIQTSATPQTAQKWTNILTWLDDTQDLFSLVAFSGRFAVKTALRFLPRVEGAFTPFLLAKNPLFKALVGRVIPYLGWVLIAADILKLLTLLATLIQPFFVAMCHGWSKGLFGAFPSLMMGNAAKLVGHGITGLNPFSKAARLARIDKFTGRMFRVGELLEIAQAMKTITGYGLTLGGIMGTLTESAYALELAARGQPVSIATPGGGRIFLHQGDLTAYSPGSAKGLSELYRKMGRTMTRPGDREQAEANANAIEQLGI